MEDELGHFSSVVQDFRQARRKAALEMLLARFRGASPELLSYEDVRRKLKATASVERGLHDIPLDAIVGSVGRYADFTRSFLPKQDTDQSRWVRVKVATTSMEGLPPIEVYKIGEVYFVKDGNHRVSIARELGAKSIQAYVTEVATRVPLTPDVQPDDLILKAEYVGFLERTHIDELCPDADFTVTAPGQYVTLEDHINVHRYYMGLDLRRDITPAEAVVHWYHHIYLPIIYIIRRHNLLREFPDRTETDLYLWLSEHREALKAEIGWEINPEAAAEDLAQRFGGKFTRTIRRALQKLLEIMTPDPLESGPPPGEWREKKTRYREDRLFHDILVPLNGEESGWRALDQAIEIARREEGRVYGLHVVPTEAHKETRRAIEAEREFARRCAAANVPGNFAFAVGAVGRQIIARAQWADLLVASLTYPPGSQLFAKLKSGFRTLVQRAPIPVLAVPGSLFPFKSALLAYDGSPKSREALFVMSYLAARWQDFALTVLTVETNGKAADEPLASAQRYLEEHGLQATYLQQRARSVAQAILQTAEERQSDLIVMGSYSRAAPVEMFFGSAVNQVLRERRRPVLICR
ncbi:MAG TPA: universal stress protein [Anaerolineae bacterium]|nr:universal stress protein [Anaerolineae bacterium]HQI87298.1 universal stress protein [Anaerolineae bacterium]